MFLQFGVVVGVRMLQQARTTACCHEVSSQAFETSFTSSCSIPGALHSTKQAPLAVDLFPVFDQPVPALLNALCPCSRDLQSRAG
jgi:hypothetical protein